MKWLHRTRPVDPRGSAALGDAHKNLRDAEQGKVAAEAAWPEVRRVVGNLRELRERNGFAEMVKDAMKGSA